MVAVDEGIFDRDGDDINILSGELPNVRDISTTILNNIASAFEQTTALEFFSGCFQIFRGPVYEFVSLWRSSTIDQAQIATLLKNPLYELDKRISTKLLKLFQEPELHILRKDLTFFVSLLGCLWPTDYSDDSMGVRFPRTYVALHERIVSELKSWSPQDTDCQIIGTVDDGLRAYPIDRVLMHLSDDSFFRTHFIEAEDPQEVWQQISGGLFLSRYLEREDWVDIRMQMIQLCCGDNSAVARYIALISAFRCSGDFGEQLISEMIESAKDPLVKEFAHAYFERKKWTLSSSIATQIADDETMVADAIRSAMKKLGFDTSRIQAVINAFLVSDDPMSVIKSLERKLREQITGDWGGERLYKSRPNVSFLKVSDISDRELLLDIEEQLRGKDYGFYTTVELDGKEYYVLCIGLVSDEDIKKYIGSEEIDAMTCWGIPGEDHCLAVGDVYKGNLRIGSCDIALARPV